MYVVQSFSPEHNSWKKSLKAQHCHNIYFHFCVCELLTATICTAHTFCQLINKTAAYCGISVKIVKLFLYFLRKQCTRRHFIVTSHEQSELYQHLKQRYNRLHMFSDCIYGWFDSYNNALNKFGCPLAKLLILPFHFPALFSLDTAANAFYRDYAAIVFFANNRFETGKKKLQYLTFQDFAFCAGQLISNWTVGAIGKRISI